MCGWALSWRMSGPATSIWVWFLCTFLRSFWLQHPRCAGEHYHGGWEAQPQATEVYSCAFSCKAFAWKHNNTLQWHFFHMGLYLSSWLLGDHKQRSSFYWPLIYLVKIFLGRGESVALHLLDCDFNSVSKSLIHVSSIVTIQHKNAWSSASNLSSTLIVPWAWEIGYTQPCIKCQGKSTTHFVNFWSRKTSPLYTSRSHFIHSTARSKLSHLNHFPIYYRLLQK